MATTEVAFSGEGSPAQATSEEKQTQAQGLSKEEIQAIVKETTMASLTEWNKQQQSLRAKAKNKVRQEAQQQIENIRSSGVELTEEQANAFLKHTVSQFEAEFEPDADEPQRPAQQQQAVSPEQSMVDRVYAKYGFKLMADDPEAQRLPQGTDFEEWYEAFLGQMKAKANRMQTPPQARTPAMGSGVQTDLRSKYQEELKGVQGNVDALFALKKKYQDMGLQV